MDKTYIFKLSHFYFIGSNLQNNSNFASNNNNKGFIPYRNSTLTMILRESLGGNSHAIMVQYFKINIIYSYYYS